MAVEPLVAALLGAAGVVLIRWFPAGPGAVAALVLWTAVTLVRGERGIAHWFKHLPLFGSLLSACTLLLRWYSLISLEQAQRLLPAVPAALAVASAATISLAYVTRPVDDAAFRRQSSLNWTQVLIATATALLVAAACGWRIAVVLTLSAWALVRVAGIVRRSAVRGSDLDGVAALTQTLTLVLAASLRTLIEPL